jgi:hypothetical protein
MREITPREWPPIIVALADKLRMTIRTGILALPVHVLITDGDDELVWEADVDASVIPLTPDPDHGQLPLKYTMTDSAGRTTEDVLTEEMVDKLRSVS